MKLTQKTLINDSKEPSRILIVAAMDVESSAIAEALGEHQTISLSTPLGINAKVYSHNNRSIIVVKTGIGSVNAGVATALVADKMHIDGVILLGVAGSIQPDLEIGQIVIGSHILQHDSVFSGSEGTKFMAPGHPYVSLPPNERVDPIFKTDHAFNEWIQVRIRRSTQLRVTAGVILSGSEFVGTPERKAELSLLNKNGMVVEMEAAGIATIASRLNVPFAVIKTVADRLNPTGTVSEDYNQFIKSAASNAGIVVRCLWEE